MFSFASAQELLKSRFGFSTFRGQQLDAVAAVLEGRDCLYIAATGSGKSLVYQFPTLYNHAHGPRKGARSTTIVVSPLVSLMEDQAMSMRAAGVSVAALHSDTPNVASEWERAYRGDFDLLYITPESAISRLTGLASMFSRSLIDLIAIDEAHTVSEWGVDFRPDYRRLSQLRTAMPGVPILALTATAPPKVRTDIERQLGLVNPLRVIATFNRPNLHYTVRQKSSRGLAFDLREVLTDPTTQCAPQGSIIVYCQTVKATQEVAAAINGLRIPLPASAPPTSVASSAAPSSSSSVLGGVSSSTGGPSPVPARQLPFAAPSSNSSIAGLNLRPAPSSGLAAASDQGIGASSSSSSSSSSTVSQLRPDSGRGTLRAAPYHAQMPPGERMAVHQAFVRDEVQVVVATIAFGMGIDKKDIRLVVNYGVSKTLESYYQQTGRAGRDGDPARCALFWSPGDFATISHLIGPSGSSSSSSAGHGEPVSAQEGFDAIKRFVTDLSRCRRSALLSYFGEAVPADGAHFLPSQGCCDNCDRSKRPTGEGGEGAAGGFSPQAYDFTADARQLLAALVFCGPSYGISKPIGVLRGTKDQSMLAAFGGVERVKSVPIYGKGAGKSEKHWQWVLRVLLEHQLVTMKTNAGERFSYTSYPLTSRGHSFLKASESLPPHPVTDDMVDSVHGVRRVPVGQSASSATGAGAARAGPGGLGLILSRALSPAEESLRGALNTLRQRFVEEESLPSFQIMPESLLRQLVSVRPGDLATLASLENMSDVRVAKYGGRILAMLQASCAQLGLAMTLAKPVEGDGSAASPTAASSSSALASMRPSSGTDGSYGEGGSSSSASMPLFPPGQSMQPVDLISAFTEVGITNENQRSAWIRIMLGRESVEAVAASFTSSAKQQGLLPKTVLDYLVKCIDQGFLSSLIRGIVLRPVAANALIQQAASVVLLPGAEPASMSHPFFMGHAGVYTFPSLAAFGSYDSLARFVLIDRCRLDPALVTVLSDAVRSQAKAKRKMHVYWVPSDSLAPTSSSSPPSLFRLVEQAEHDAEALGSSPASSASSSGAPLFGMRDVMEVVTDAKFQNYEALRVVLALVKARRRHIAEIAALEAHARASTSNQAATATSSTGGSPLQNEPSPPAEGPDGNVSISSLEGSSSMVAASVEALDSSSHSASGASAVLEHDVFDDSDWAGVLEWEAQFVQKQTLGGKGRVGGAQQLPVNHGDGSRGASEPRSGSKRSFSSSEPLPPVKVARNDGTPGHVHASSSELASSASTARAFIISQLGSFPRHVVHLLAEYVMSRAPHAEGPQRKQTYDHFECAVATLSQERRVADSGGILRLLEAPVSAARHFEPTSGVELHALLPATAAPITPAAPRPGASSSFNSSATSSGSRGGGGFGFSMDTNDLEF